VSEHRRVRPADLSPQAAALRHGHAANRPWQIPWLGWRAVLWRSMGEMISDRISLVAAGCAFYATLALFPAITMLISIYGLMFNPDSIEPQLQILRRLLPPSAYSLISERVQALVSHPTQSLSVGLAVSAAVTLWSAATGTKSMLSALNLAYEEKESRSFIRFQATALLMTLLAILAAVAGLALLVGLPAVVGFFGLSAYARRLIGVASFVILLIFVSLSLSLLYRYGPSRRPAQWHWITPGSMIATLLWLLASAMVSFYIGRIASYDVTYGPLGAVVGIMMWFFVTVFVVLFGAEINAELELQTAQDSTVGAPQPVGERGAFVADHVADP
jgi:membrane protein